MKNFREYASHREARDVTVRGDHGVGVGATPFPPPLATIAPFVVTSALLVAVDRRTKAGGNAVIKDRRSTILNDAAVARGTA